MIYYKGFCKLIYHYCNLKQIKKINLNKKQMIKIKNNKKWRLLLKNFNNLIRWKIKKIKLIYNNMLMNKKMKKQQNNVK